MQRLSSASGTDDEEIPVRGALLLPAHSLEYALASVVLISSMLPMRDGDHSLLPMRDGDHSYFAGC